MNQKIAFAKELVKYKDKWFALQGKRVIASGRACGGTGESPRKNITDFAFHYVPSKRLAMAL